MNIGDLKYKIKIYNQIRTKVGSSFTISYDLLYNIYASRKYLTGIKLIDNNEIFNKVTIEFITYYRKNITESCIIEFENKKYKINSIQVIGDYEGLKYDVELINN